MYYNLVIDWTDQLSNWISQTVNWDDPFDYQFGFENIRKKLSETALLTTIVFTWSLLEMCKWEKI